MAAKCIGLETGRLISIINEADAKQLGIHPLDRIEIFNQRTNKNVITVIDVTKKMVQAGEAGLFLEACEKLQAKPGDSLEVKAVQRPKSIDFIKKKMRGEQLSRDEIKTIVDDIDKNRLSDIELSAFMAAVYIHGYSLDETVFMTQSLSGNGSKLSVEREPVVDKHSIGGINGRATMILVPIAAVGGLYVPKTSSRSITSAAGTADAMEVLASVSISKQRIKEIVESIGGVVVWGGALDLAPVDDKIIKVEYPLSLDPEGQVIASVMAKKSAAGAKFVVIDIPIGPGMKIDSREKGASLAKKFIEVGKKLGIKVEAVLTDGTQPSGKAFGPALEAKHVLEILEGKTFNNLAQKSCELAGVLFELVGKAKEGEGYSMAREILESGKALAKMKDMIQAQGAFIDSSEKIELSSMKKMIYASQGGEISGINAKRLIVTSRIAGAPVDKKAGVWLHVDIGDKIKAGDLLFEIFAENDRKLGLAEKFAKENTIVELEKIILEKIT